MSACDLFNAFIPIELSFKILHYLHHSIHLSVCILWDIIQTFIIVLLELNEVLVPSFKLFYFSDIVRDCYSKLCVLGSIGVVLIREHFCRASETGDMLPGPFCFV